MSPQRILNTNQIKSHHQSFIYTTTTFEIPSHSVWRQAKYIYFYENRININVIKLKGNKIQKKISLFCEIFISFFFQFLVAAFKKSGILLHSAALYRLTCVCAQYSWKAGFESCRHCKFLRLIAFISKSGKEPPLSGVLLESYRKMIIKQLLCLLIHRNWLLQ